MTETRNQTKKNTKITQTNKQTILVQTRPGAGLRCDAPEPGSTACKTLVHSEVDSPMRRSTAPSGGGAHPKGHCHSTLANEPAPLGRDVTSHKEYGMGTGILIPITPTQLWEWGGNRESSYEKNLVTSAGKFFLRIASELEKVIARTFDEIFSCSSLTK